MAQTYGTHLLFGGADSPHTFARNKKAATTGVSRLFLLDTLGSVN